jgi:hypothetical protein
VESDAGIDGGGKGSCSNALFLNSSVDDGGGDEESKSPNVELVIVVVIGVLGVGSVVS